MSESKELVRTTRVAAERALGGQISFTDLLKLCTLPPEKIKPTSIEVPVPGKLILSESQLSALEKLPKVYSKTVPTSRRKLTDPELSSLIEERAVLDEVVKLIEARKEAIKEFVFNHLDVEAERVEAVDSSTIRTSEGHYALKARVGPRDGTKEFSREVTGGNLQVSLAILEELVGAGELSKDSFGTMTRVETVIDERGVMEALRKDPGLASAIAKAVIPGKPRVALYVRNRKGVEK